MSEAIPSEKPSAAYQVKLEVFEGPMDLLLSLIERQELDITVVSLAKVTGQYLDYVRQLEEASPESLADFLVVAARLIYIKSLTLLPQPEGTDEELQDEEDVGEDLVRQLIEYRKYREAAQTLSQRLESGLHAHVRIAPPPRIGTPTFRLEGVTLENLWRAAQEAMEHLPSTPPVSELVSPLEVTLADQSALIRERLGQASRVAFSQLLHDARSRAEIIVTLLAALEMVKQLEIVLYQDTPFGEIWMEASPNHESQIAGLPDRTDD